MDVLEPAHGSRIQQSYQCLSSLVEKILKPEIPYLAIYIKDDWHFMNTSKGNQIAMLLCTRAI